ncbi:hypothetical protein GIB67_006241, partial [Kingdonia uniflora]
DFSRLSAYALVTCTSKNQATLAFDCKCSIIYPTKLSKKNKIKHYMASLSSELG